jgi:hypothetical protein
VPGRTSSGATTSRSRTSSSIVAPRRENPPGRTSPAAERHVSPKPERAQRQPGFASVPGQQIQTGVASKLTHFRLFVESDRESADVRVVEGDGRLRRQGEQHDLDFIETVPQPDVAPGNPAYPCPPDGPLDGLEVRWTRQPIGVAEGIDNATHGQRSLRAKLDQSAKLARIPSRYSSSSRHDSSPTPAMYRTKASVAAGDRNSPRSAQPIAARTSAASSGWGFQTLGAAFWAVSESTSPRVAPRRAGGQQR